MGSFLYRCLYIPTSLQILVDLEILNILVHHLNDGFHIRRHL